MIFITIEQIQYFLAVKKYNGFSMAAHELCISQSSLSKHIKSLEQELDTVLFDRTARTPKLTKAGEDFYIHAENFLNEYNNILFSMRKHSFSKKAALRIGTIAVISQYGLTSSLAAFKNYYPSIDINIIEDENEAILNMISNGEVDVAIARDFNLPRDKYDITTIASDELVIVTSSNHNFAKKKYVTFEDLRDENLIICSKSGVYNVCQKECSKLGFDPKVIYNISKIETILGLVSENLGITAIVNTVLNQFKNENIHILPFKKRINADLVLVTKKKAAYKKEIETFKDFIIKK